MKLPTAYPLEAHYDRDRHRPRRALLAAFRLIAASGSSYRMTVKAAEAEIIARALAEMDEDE